MKNQLSLILLLISFGASATEIQGTLMLRGTVKTNVTINSVKSVCKLKVEKVKNLLQEDSFGNPGYQAKIVISLNGRDLERNLKVKFDKELTIVNLHLEKSVRRVKDFDYASIEEAVTVTIDEEGRIVNTTFPYQQQTVKCNF